MFRVEVKNLGPIIEGGVDVKPLTIFIGPNNSGKSYMAMLIHSLHGLVPSFSEATKAAKEELKQNDAAKASWEKWLEEHPPSAFPFKISLGSLPDEVKEALHKVIKEGILRSAPWLASEIMRCYGSSLSGLVRRQEPNGKLSLSISREESAFLFTLSSDADGLKVDNVRFPLPEGGIVVGWNLGGGRPMAPARPPLSEANGEISGEIFENAVFATLLKLFGGLPFFPVHYLPAARSGLLQGHKALARSIIERSPLAGIEAPLDIPRFTGAIADFLSALLGIDPMKPTKLAELAELLEKEVAKGSIVVERERHLYPEIFYEDERTGRLPLHRTSSGISELAPLVLFLRYVVEPGSYLIIEEPEAHLHPGAQRKLALGLVRLVRAGVKLLITTHSDYLVDQLSNFISLSQLPEKDKKKQGYGKEDYLTPEEVGAYLFKLDEAAGGSTIETLKVDKEGIDEEEFSKVAGELYDETVYLRRKLSA